MAPELTGRASRIADVGVRLFRVGAGRVCLSLPSRTATRQAPAVSAFAPATKRERANMRHALGVLGVLAAGVLLAVSAAMNWRFGFSLGRTELDGQIYGAASAAADCMKALVPFFFFAAIRNRMWSQAAASALGLGRGHGLLADLGTRPCGVEPVRLRPASAPQPLRPTRTIAPTWRGPRSNCPGSRSTVLLRRCRPRSMR